MPRATAPRPTCTRASQCRSIVRRRALAGGRSKPQWGPAPAGCRATAARSSCSASGSATSSSASSRPSGYEGDPMRLLFEKGCTPTHAFSAFYRWLQRRLQCARGAALRHPRQPRVHARQADRPVPPNCWPDRLIGDLPNIYLYAANNPSAKARSPSAAPRRTLVSYLTPPLADSGRVPGPGRPRRLRSTAGAAWNRRPRRERAELAAIRRGGRAGTQPPPSPAWGAADQASTSA